MSQRTRLLGLMSVLMAMAVVSGACAKTTKKTTSASPKAATITGSIDVADQTSDGTTVKFASLTITGGNGFIAMHQDLNGQPGPVPEGYHSELIAAGTHTNFTITLSTKIPAGTYWPMLHVDSNHNGIYDFKAGNTPVLDPPVQSAGQIVMKQIKLTVS